MQDDKIHTTCTSHNPMQLAMIFSANIIIPPILEWLKDGIRKLKFDFNAARTYKEWLPHNSHRGDLQKPTREGHHHVVMHLFDTALPRAVFKAQIDGADRDLLWFNRIDTALAEQARGINRLETALGRVWQSLGILTPATRAHKRGRGKGVSMVDGMEVIE